MDYHRGQCLCGAIVVEAEGVPDRIGICHCLDCRRHHGAAFYAAAIFPQEAVQIRGQPQSYAGRFFCPTCGSSVFARSGSEIEIHLGSLDQWGTLLPQYELWTLRRAPWLPAFCGIASYDKNREAPAP